MFVFLCGVGRHPETEMGWFISLEIGTALVSFVSSQNIIRKTRLKQLVIKLSWSQGKADFMFCMHTSCIYLLTGSNFVTQCTHAHGEWNNQSVIWLIWQVWYEKLEEKQKDMVQMPKILRMHLIVWLFGEMTTNSSSHIAYTQRPFLLSHQVASYLAKFPALVMQTTIAGMNIIFLCWQWSWCVVYERKTF